MTILERLRDAEVEIKQLRQELAEQLQENAKLREACRLLFSMIHPSTVPSNIYTEMPWLANESERYLV